MHDEHARWMCAYQRKKEQKQTKYKRDYDGVTLKKNF